jgi:hypothetical protein
LKGLFSSGRFRNLQSPEFLNKECSIPSSTCAEIDAKTRPFRCVGRSAVHSGAKVPAVFGPQPPCDRRTKPQLAAKWLPTPPQPHFCCPVGPGSA